jgi:hypothetical protein
MRRRRNKKKMEEEISLFLIISYHNNNEPFCVSQTFLSSPQSWKGGGSDLCAVVERGVGGGGGSIPVPSQVTTFCTGI